MHVCTFTELLRDMADDCASILITIINILIFLLILPDK